MSDAAMVLAAAVVLDTLLGDPVYRLHPVRLIGALAGWLERGLRRSGLTGIAGGVLLTGAVLIVVTGTYGLVRHAIKLLAGGLAVVFDIYTVYSCLALRDMLKHARPVENALAAGDADTARSRLRRIVGRDVSGLDPEGMARAAVESVAESFVDGFLSPVFWFVVAGVIAGYAGVPALPFAVAFALAYRSVNTLDSMVGYRNKRYFRFGRAAARTDDVLNFIPARLSLPVLWLGCFPVGLDARRGWRTALRDRLKHASPNSAHAESFVAGALGLRLGGPTKYSHGTVDKPWLGDGMERATPEHLKRVCRLSLASGMVSAVLALLLLEIFS